MKNYRNLFFLMLFLIVLLRSALCSSSSTISIVLSPPEGKLKMGDMISFKSQINNISGQDLGSLVAWLSLVSLEPRNEKPMDLEDWSAQKAIRIGSLNRKDTVFTDWPMRLIKSGKYGVTITVMNPKEDFPVVSKMLKFFVASKQTVVPGKIIPVALGEPLIIGIFFLIIYLFRKKSR